MQNLSRVSIDKVPGILAVLWKSNKVAMIWGPPGVGKSVMIREIASEQYYTVQIDERLLKHFHETFKDVCGKTFKGRRVFDNRLLLMNPTDIKGLPVFNAQKEEAEWLATNNFPMSPKRLEELIERITRVDAHGNLLADADMINRLMPRILSGLHDQHAVVFLDELSLAPKLVQGAALQLVLDRAVGEYMLPENVDMVAAGNRVEDKVGATAMSPALVSRMTHIHIDEPTYNKWRHWAFANDVVPEVLGFLNFKPEMIFEFDANTMAGRGGSSSYPCPRTWEMASDIYKDIKMLPDSEKDLRTITEAVLSGTLGEGVAADFMAWVDIYVHLPKPETVLSGKVKDIDFEAVVKKSGNVSNDRQIKSKALSMKFAFINSLISTMTKSFTVESAQNVAAFINKKGIEDAEWAMMLIKRTTSFYIDTDDPKITQIYTEVLGDAGGHWITMQNELSKVMNSSDLRKAG